MVHTLNMEKREMAREGILFLAQLGVLACVLFLLLQPLEIFLQELVTIHARVVLHAIGTNTMEQNSIQFWAGNKLVEISPLCAGLIELILLASAIAATRTVSIEKKMKGILVGIILLHALNVLRIAITVQQLVHVSFTFAEFTHDVFFRLVLIIGFAAIYGGWLNIEKIVKKSRAKGII